VTTLEERVAAIESGPEGAEVAAFFDFDGTLIEGFSAVAYFADRFSRGAMGASEMLSTLGLALRGQPSDAEFDAILRGGVAAWGGQTEEEVRALWQRLFQERIAAALRPEAWALVRAHARRGHTIAIASSATQFQVAPIASELGIEHLLTTRARVRNGRLTGGLDGGPIWGPAKAAAVRGFAAERGIDLACSHAYGNGDEDIAFLRAVGRPTAICPSPALERVARDERWPILACAPRGLSLASRARSVGAYAAMAGILAGGLAYAAVSGETQRAIDGIGAIGADLGLLVGGIELDVQGEEHLRSHRPAVFILNHQSQLDYFVMLKLTRERFTGVAKKEAAEVPGFGPFMKMTGMAFIDRSDTLRAIEGLTPAIEKLRQGISIGMSPEGTRSYSPKLGRFKKGAFHIAMQAGVPIVPVVLRNAGELMTRDTLTMQPGKVEVFVHPPIDVSGWRVEELDLKVAEVRRLFVDTMEHWPKRGSA